MPSDGDSSERDAPNATTTSDAPAGEQPATQEKQPARRPSDPRMASQRVQAALAASTRTEASLSGLMRAVQEVTSGLSGAREANDQLTQELGNVREALTASIEEKTALEVQLASLIVERDHALRELEQAHVDAERERTFLIEEQDRFLAALLDEHEQVLNKLRAELLAQTPTREHNQTKTTPPAVRRVRSDELPTEVSVLQRELADAKQTVDKLLAERERSLETLRRLQAQRDEAQQALAAGMLRESTKTDPAGPLERAALGFPAEATGARRIDQATRPTDPAGAKRRAEADSPSAAAANGLDADLRRELPTPPDGQRMNPSPAAPPASDAKAAKSPLKRKPDPASMPLGSYSLRSEDLDTEQAEAGLSPLKPPRH